MADSIFNQFALAGGTALSLLIGHRKSIDLDLFTTGEFNPSQLEKYLQKTYQFKGDLLSGFSLKGEVNDVKLDFIRHDYPDIEPRKQEDGIRLYSLKDIAAMKLSAIADNGTRLKDFIDVAYLSGYLSLKEMLTAFETKYPQTNPYRAVKGLNYYDDIRFSERIDLLGKDFRWETIAARLADMVREENKRFQPLIEIEKEKRMKIPKKRGRGI
ncbi:nucleotidyl transferase AbiEii/AbiGii toxin family protein [Massilibacteroides sp.]|uniref:nucleotidyl transferase AbiEii/AbiGii toxin family protein n=1 Tax=Massilibacteroides sp. TaxID=2034766 RepID=UPI00262F1031|nr:nucleotidyl transferase AbiEii/AbiGii toxin family protein [Massilibacteroides sp.]MDD4516872.1 nucleotidyl transferase AbiEii/AbiGii toxin family protein [Massilibacteroides sp.]